VFDVGASSSRSASPALNRCSAKRQLQTIAAAMPTISMTVYAKPVCGDNPVLVGAGGEQRNDYDTQWLCVLAVSQIVNCGGAQHKWMPQKYNKAVPYSVCKL
jgi:hypothetical protein